MADKVVAKSAARDEIADAQRGECFEISKTHACAKERNISGYISA
jgi:TusA-related sulfurtransferase